jgi:hypothetical protein
LPCAPALLFSVGCAALGTIETIAKSNPAAMAAPSNMITSLFIVPYVYVVIYLNKMKSDKISI